MPLPTPSLTYDFATTVEAIVAPYRNGYITIYDPAVFTLDAPYNAVTDTGGHKSYTALWAGPALIYPLRTEEPKATLGDEWSVKEAYQFDIGMNNLFLRKGLRISVTNGGNNPMLEKMGFSIVAAPGGSWANQHTITAVSEVAQAN